MRSGTQQYGYRLALLLSVVAAVVGGGALVFAWRVPALQAVPVRDTEGEYAATADLEGMDWGVFRSDHGTVPVGGGDLSRRFRLAGTFFADVPGVDTRKAILDDLQGGGQHIVGEQSRIDDVEVVRILDDRVVLRRGAEEAELWLGFSSDGKRPGTDVDATAFGEGADGGPDTEDTFGGRRTGEHAWVYGREAIVAYYQGLLDDPERLVGLFDSMKPMRGPDGRITGYQLDIVGEQDFYASVGMRQGDVVRKVNGMHMTSRRRAEYWIGEFARDRSSAFTIDVERNGQPLTLTYQVR